MIALARLLMELRKWGRLVLDYAQGAIVVCWVFTSFCSPVQGDRPREEQKIAAQQLLNEDAEVLYAEFERLMAVGYQITVLSREILKLPSLPEEGY
jgi:hypothetical protein